MRKIVFSEEEIQQIEKLYLEDKKSLVAIGKLFKVSSQTIGRLLDSRGVPRNPNRKFLIKEDIFEKIDSAEKAYWLGFILADGYLLENRNRIAIKLGSLDGEAHLKKFIKFIGGPEEMLKTEHHNITGKLMYYVNINSVKMTKDLKDKKVSQRKSTKEEWCEDIPEDYIKDYIRGIIDGDGNINEHDFNICNSEEVLSQIKNYFLKKYDINPNIKILDHCNTKRIHFCKKEMKF